MATRYKRQTVKHIEKTEVVESNASYVLDFQRFEFKYVMPSSYVDALIPDLLRYMDYDKHSKGDYYKLYSVYFDTINWDSYYEKIAGIEHRKKYRVRSYYPTLKEDDPVFIEVKEKEKDIILKRRKDIPYGKLDDFVNNRYYDHDPILDEWRFHIMRENLRAKILIEYERLPFVPKGRQDIRVTIDRNLAYAMMKDRKINFGAKTKSVESMREHCVVEIKFKNFLPLWTHQLIQKYNMRNDAFSKFTESVIYNYKLT